MTSVSGDIYLIRLNTKRTEPDSSARPDRARPRKTMTSEGLDSEDNDTNRIEGGRNYRELGKETFSRDCDKCR